jgi:hypothetical protein
MGRKRRIAPGTSLVLTQDLLREYDLSRSGAYRIRFEEQGGPPPSNVAAFEVMPHGADEPKPSIGWAYPQGFAEAIASVLFERWVCFGTSEPCDRPDNVDAPREVWVQYRKPVATARMLEIGQEGVRLRLFLLDRRGDERKLLAEHKARLIGSNAWYRAYAIGRPHPSLGWKDPDGDLARVLKLERP